jgi:hypothetical protein
MKMLIFHSSPKRKKLGCVELLVSNRRVPKVTILLGSQKWNMFLFYNIIAYYNFFNLLTNYTPSFIFLVSSFRFCNCSFWYCITTSSIVRFLDLVAVADSTDTVTATASIIFTTTIIIIICTTATTTATIIIIIITINYYY